jgi:hypothetical protein
MNGSNGSMFHLRLRYPVGWAELTPADRERIGFELALRTGQRLAYLMMIWHETATWFGDRTLLFDESPSAFTYDDGMSHVIGVHVAELALRDPERPFNAAVTYHLGEQLRALGAVGPEQTQQAVDAVNGRWWVDGRPLKRQTHTGLENGVVYPWLVSNLPFAGNSPAQPFAVPRVGMVFDYDMSNFCSVNIEPRIAAAMRRCLPSPSEQLDVDRDLPLVLRAMRGQMRQQFGPQVSVPWPLPAKPIRLARAR